MENSTTPGVGGDALSGAPNGVPSPQADGAEDTRSPAMRRAEELVDRWGEKVGRYATTVGHAFLRWATRAREEAEDIWAEAQAVHEGWRNPGKSPEVPPKG